MLLLMVLNFTLLTIITDSTWCFNAILGAILGGNGAIFLYNKENNTWMLGNMDFISSVVIIFKGTQNPDRKLCT